jgi:D-alanine-D-alanine ligase
MPAARRLRIRVAVLFGGRSSEHAVSCLSAGSVLAALDRERCDPVPVGITRDGGWVLAPDDPGSLAVRGRELPFVDPSWPSVTLAGDPTVPLLRPVDAGEPSIGPIDVVFPLLHGAFGEDGTVQGLLELSGVPYVGSGVLASAAAMDKEFMKRLLAARGIPVGRWAAVRAGDPVSEEVSRLRMPLFVKPARGGSSIGTRRVRHRAELADALAEAHQHDPKAMVEEELTGREIECGLLESGRRGAPETSAPGEIRVSAGHDFYDFGAKYLGGTDTSVPADLPASVADRAQQLAARAFVALGCEGLARVDLFVGANGAPVVNEVNTMPGFTPASMFPRMWAAAGLDYPALVDRLLTTALARRPGLR